MARRRHGAEPSGFTLLVIDDQEETLISSKLLLEREGHRVLTASSGREGLSIFRSVPIDVLIVDYFMPEMTGEQVIRAVRALDEDVQMILQTGYSGEKPPREMMKLLDIQGYHDKSDGPERLLLWVDVMLKAATQLRRVRDKERELSESHAQLSRLSARLINAQEDERERISRELHDQLGQLLTAIGLDLDWALTRCRAEPAEISERLLEAKGLVQQAIEETRALSANLRAGDLRGSSLPDAICAAGAEFARRSGIALKCKSAAGEVKLSADSGRHVYRIVQEALSNVVRHASARAVTLELSHDAGNFIVRIEDDGRGFDPAGVKDPRAVGLVGMRERAKLIGARLELGSAPGKGTRITLEVPLSGPAV